MLSRSRLFAFAIRVAAIGVVLLAILVFFSRSLLTVDSGEQKADALVVLGGGLEQRPERAAELFADGAAPIIIVSGRGDCDSNVALLEKLGVPASAIVREDKSRNTRENAAFSAAILRQLKARRAIIVTSWYHSRRALACFRHFGPGLQFYSRPSYSHGGFNPVRSLGTLRDVVIEYIKLPGYWLFHGISPFDETPAA